MGVILLRGLILLKLVGTLAYSVHVKKLKIESFLITMIMMMISLKTQKTLHEKRLGSNLNSKGLIDDED
jgi:hypothetical protein